MSDIGNDVKILKQDMSTVKDGFGRLENEHKLINAQLGVIEKNHLAHIQKDISGIKMDVLALDGKIDGLDQKLDLIIQNQAQK